MMLSFGTLYRPAENLLETWQSQGGAGWKGWCNKRSSTEGSWERQKDHTTAMVQLLYPFEVPGPCQKIAVSTDRISTVDQAIQNLPEETQIADDVHECTTSQ